MTAAAKGGSTSSNTGRRGRRLRLSFVLGARARFAPGWFVGLRAPLVLMRVSDAALPPDSDAREIGFPPVATLDATLRDAPWLSLALNLGSRCWRSLLSPTMPARCSCSRRAAQSSVWGST